MTRGEVKPLLDKEWMKKQLVEVLSTRPDLFAQVDSLFWREGAPYKAGLMFKHFFCIVEGPASEAGYPMAAISIRNEDEIISALMALESLHAHRA